LHASINSVENIFAFFKVFLFITNTALVVNCRAWNPLILT